MTPNEAEAQGRSEGTDTAGAGMGPMERWLTELYWDARKRGDDEQIDLYKMLSESRRAREIDAALTAEQARAEKAEERYQQTLALLGEEVNRADAAERERDQAVADREAVVREILSHEMVSGSMAGYINAYYVRDMLKSLSAALTPTEAEA